MVNKRVGNMRRDNERRGGFDYRPAKPEYVKRQSERRGGRQFDTIFKDKFLVLSRLTDGDNRLRILPASWEGHDDFAYIAWVHKFINERGSYLCALKMKDEPCALCEEASQARKDKDDERARELGCSELMICWVLDRKSREFEDQPQLYAMPPTLYKDINGIIYDIDSGKATELDNPRKGYDVRIKRTGTGLNTRYLPILSGHATAISEERDVINDILAYIKKNPIPDCLEFKSNGYLEKVLSGGASTRDEDLDEDDEADEDEEDEDGDRKSKRRKEQRMKQEGREARAAARSRRDEEEEEEEEEPDDEQEEEEDQDEADDEAEEDTEADNGDEDEPDDDEDDEEDRPRQRLKTKSKSKSSKSKRRDDDDDEEDFTPRRAPRERERT